MFEGKQGDQVKEKKKWPGSRVFCASTLCSLNTWPSLFQSHQYKADMSRDILDRFLAKWLALASYLSPLQMKFCWTRRLVGRPVWPWGWGEGAFLIKAGAEKFTVHGDSSKPALARLCPCSWISGGLLPWDPKKQKGDGEGPTQICGIWSFSLMGRGRSQPEWTQPPNYSTCPHILISVSAS